MQRLLLIAVVFGSSAFMSAQGWSAWRHDAVFPGIEVRERCGGFNEFANRFMWDVQLRNTYQKNVDLSWAADPGQLRGDQAQADQALGVRPGEIVDAHHAAPQDCPAGLVVRVNEVRAAGTAAAGNAPTNSLRPVIQGRWQSRDPEPLRKELVVQLDGKTVISTWSSPGFSFQISTPLPEGVSGSVSLERGPK